MNADERRYEQDTDSKKTRRQRSLPAGEQFSDCKLA